LRGICRSLDISLQWRLAFIAEVYRELPDDLCAQQSSPPRPLQLLRLQAETDELWSFVGNKSNKKWVWIAFYPLTREGLAFYFGDRSGESARELWQRIPAAYRQHATFYTDDWQAYKDVIPGYQHEVCAKGSGHRNGVERFNCSLRQRVSRLVRDALSFSKKL